MCSSTRRSRAAGALAPACAAARQRRRCQRGQLSRENRGQRDAGLVRRRLPARSSADSTPTGPEGPHIAHGERPRAAAGGRADPGGVFAKGRGREVRAVARDVADAHDQAGIEAVRGDRRQRAAVVRRDPHDQARGAEHVAGPRERAGERADIRRAPRGPRRSRRRSSASRLRPGDGRFGTGSTGSTGSTCASGGAARLRRGFFSASASFWRHSLGSFGGGRAGSRTSGDDEPRPPRRQPPARPVPAAGRQLLLAVALKRLSRPRSLLAGRRHQVADFGEDHVAGEQDSPRSA